jgi:hypothetical protein
MSLPTRNGSANDGPSPPPATASRILRLIAVAILVAVAAVGIGAASRPHSVDVSLSTPELGGLSVLVLLVAACVVGLLVGRNFVAAWSRAPELEDPDRKKTSMPRVVRILLPLFLLMAAAFVRMWAAGQDRTIRTPNLSNTTPIKPLDAPTTGGDIGLLLACIGLAVSAAVVAALLFRRHTPLILPPAPPEGAAAILDEGLGALLGESDPRRAVIAAYMAMERAMARQGWARRPAEAPTEYLRRVLGVAPARARDLDHIVDLYQVARFSEHPVTSGMRDVAVDCVRRLRADLQIRAEAPAQAPA